MNESQIVKVFMETHKLFFDYGWTLCASDFNFALQAPDGSLYAIESIDGVLAASLVFKHLKEEEE